MPTTADFNRWLDEGERAGATHTLIFWDNFDNSHYAIQVTSKERAREVVKEHETCFDTFMECYDLSMDRETQLKEWRARNF